MRKADRDYKEGDAVLMEEWDPEFGYTGEVLLVEIAYVLRDAQKWGVKEGYVVFGW